MRAELSRRRIAATKSRTVAQASSPAGSGGGQDAKRQGQRPWTGGNRDNRGQAGFL